ncbi:MAG: RecQ family ATP-dependent DNA helicase [Clostridia bacterium]|nr:RecQ family ATP-dependent DNA helicase [Clostridia bacterium]
MDKLETLKYYFGHNTFRPGQETLVDALLARRDALGIMPTGAGKSMCYQIPALMTPGIALVISPLISLMKDQVMSLIASGVPAAYLNSSLTPKQLDLATERACQGAYRIIYVAPERLDTLSFRRFAMQAPISLIAVDEAHCVSQWGQDFRPSYLKIADFIESLPKRPPVGAFTATATSKVRSDIIRLLRLQHPVEASTGFDRPNLFFDVLRPKDKEAALKDLLRKRKNQSGIIYCATRRNVEEVAVKLEKAGYQVGTYHAGMSDRNRQENQEAFQEDRIQIMVATNAFGMGIDKSNVNYVIHYNMPRSMEAYYQEAGRAGRDGSKADCILLYSGADIFTAKWMIDHAEPNEALTPEERQAVRQEDLRRMEDMITYCTGGTCLRSYILRYFGERAPDTCTTCGNCVRDQAREHLFPFKKKPAVPKQEEEQPVDPDNLFELLRHCRLELARQNHVPPYMICADKTLLDMVRKRPRNPDEMLDVDGMGVKKIGKYGSAFLLVLRRYAASHPGG